MKLSLKTFLSSLLSNAFRLINTQKEDKSVTSWLQYYPHSQLNLGIKRKKKEEKFKQIFYSCAIIQNEFCFMEDSSTIVIDFCRNKFMCQRKGHTMETETAPVLSIKWKCFCLGAGVRLGFFNSRSKGIRSDCSAVSCEEESGLAPETVVQGLKCEHHRWSAREHKIGEMCLFHV